jgi:hypothetical protein
MAKVSPAARHVCIEAMESRLFCDASQLTEAVTSASLANISITAAAAGKAVVRVTNPGAALKESVKVNVYASATPLAASGPVAGNYRLAFKPISLKLAAGANATYTLPIKVKKGGLPAGSYTLYAVVADTKSASVASTGSTLVVAGAAAGGTSGVGAITPAVKTVKVSNSLALASQANTQTFKLSMLFSNITASAIKETLTVTTFFSTTKAFSASSALTLGHSTYTLSAKPHAKVTAPIPPVTETFFVGSDGIALLSGYIVVTLTDTSNAVLVAEYPKLVFIDGN